MADVRLGIVGAGAVAQRHVDRLSEVPGARVVAVADVAAKSAKALARSAGAAAYPDHRAMLEAEHLDGLYVCVPPFAHGPPERDALAAGLPVFVEKPLAAGLGVAEEVAALVARAGVPTATGYHWRSLDTVERAGELLAEAPARLASAAWLDKVPPPPWWIRRERSGGQLVEQTTHVLDLLRVLVGEVDEVWALGAQTPRPDHPEADVEDVWAGTLRFASGAVGAVTSTSLLRAKRRAGVELVAPGLALELSETELVVDRGAGPEVLPARTDAKLRVDEDFVAAIRGEGDGIRAPYGDALRTHRVACALVESAERGEAVRLA